MFEKRVGNSAYLSSSGTARRGPHLGCLSGVLSAGHAEAAPAGTCSGPHAARGAGQTRSDSNVGCLVPDHRRTMADHAALHRAGSGAGAPALQTEAESACPAPSPYPGAGPLRRGGRVENVVQTYGFGLLKTNDHLPPCAKVRLGLEVGQVVDQGGGAGTQHAHESSGLPATFRFFQGCVVGIDGILDMLEAFFLGFTFLDVAGDPLAVPCCWIR